MPIPDWGALPLGDAPDRIIAEQIGYSRSRVSQKRRELGIPAFTGLVLTQEGPPTRSVYEAKYDAYLHWKGLDHTHETPVPGLPYIADFEIGGQFIEILGMSGFKRYDTKAQKKRQAYTRAQVPVTWLTRDEIDALYKDCPVPLKFRPRFCDECGIKAREIVNGMCRPCNRKVWGEDNGAEAACEQCREPFTLPAGSTGNANRFCSHDCYSKSLELGWPSWDEIDKRLQQVSVAQLARELGVRSGTLHQRLRRRRERDPNAPAATDSRSKLTEGDVREMRSLYAEGVSQADLCRKFGLAAATVHQIVHRKTWKHVR